MLTEYFSLVLVSLEHCFRDQITMGVDEDFAAAAEDISNNVNKTLTDDELKEVYALYKQGTIGDVNTSRCNMVNPCFLLSHHGHCQAGHAGLQGQGQVGRLGGKEGDGSD